MGGETPSGPAQSWFEQQELISLRSKLLAAVRRRLPRALQDHAEDIVQQALLKVWRISQEHPERQLTNSYLLKTAYHCVVDEIRKLLKHGEVPLPLPDDDGSPGELPSTGPDPHAVVQARQIGRAIRDCLSRLPPPRLRAVVLHMWGYNARQMERLLGWNVKRAHNLVFRGLENLRECLVLKGIQR